jgi:2-polyprenyl-3-methyl-5-hydroxy-6-metoxy-1,4-benzoquinol methylase
MASHPDPASSRRHWDDQAASYARNKSRNAAYYDALKDLIDRAIPAERRQRVLEVGCGTGEILAHLRPAHGLGVDISDRMIEQARTQQAGRGALEFRVLDAAAVAALGRFDAVVCTDVLEHVADWQAVADALIGATAPGGTIVITTPNPRWALPLWVLEKVHLKMPEGPHHFVGIGAIVGRLCHRGCLVQHAGTHQLLPTRLGGLGPALSRRAEGIPVLRSLGVIQLIVAQAPDDR